MLGVSYGGYSYPGGSSGLFSEEFIIIETGEPGVWAKIDLGPLNASGQFASNVVPKPIIKAGAAAVKQTFFHSSNEPVLASALSDDPVVIADSLTELSAQLIDYSVSPDALVVVDKGASINFAPHYSYGVVIQPTQRVAKAADKPSVKSVGFSDTPSGSIVKLETSPSNSNERAAMVVIR